jgi:hypothetical protein
MKLRISRKIRAARRRAQIPALASLSTGTLAYAKLLKDSRLLPYLDRHLAQLSARLDESLNRMAFYRDLQNEKNANFAQLPSNQKDTCKNTISEPLPEAQPS